ncbi:MAG: helix-turn-helix transcriptional regulator [Candidatus Lokiarchaeota archaeon]|nr:helix-turn-helix transcriptional regulator [Candidatus Lokiarchaeota archaeon]
MWLGKFLDLEEDIEELRSKIKQEIFADITKNKLTPLEFTIVEVIFNSQALSGYDLMQTLNKHFAGTWEAKSGTIYPILSKLEKNGFLKSKMVKSPIGPLRKLYTLTTAGEELLKLKVNKNYTEQLLLIENFVVELSSIYIKSRPNEDRKEIIAEVQELLNTSFERIKENIPSTLKFKTKCSNCGSEIGRKVVYCPFCGIHFVQTDDEEKNE